MTTTKANYYVTCYFCGYFGKPIIDSNPDSYARCPKCMSARNSHYDSELDPWVKSWKPVYLADEIYKNMTDKEKESRHVLRYYKSKSESDS